MLERIVAHTLQRIEPVIAGEAEWRARARKAAPARDFAGALSSGVPAVIAEVKRRSPSRGPLAPDLDPSNLARAYARGGAAAISVLTEPEFFDGSDDDMVAIRRVVSLPVLRKDFTLHPAQVWEARAIGADAVLLIAAVLGDGELGHLVETAEEAGVAALVEIHDEPEAERALAAGARVVGVNNRDLATFAVDLATAERLAPILGGVDVRVAESGIFTQADAQRMVDAGYHAVLVGESLVRAADPAGAVAALRGRR
ncbi:MAG: indole-3-glycerol phosphate synthase TrpC [Acidimicrobiia bacterium]|jgi:indole-3-glycerol phosphate synthase